jgi:hypothetical protein
MACGMEQKAEQQVTAQGGEGGSGGVLTRFRFDEMLEHVLSIGDLKKDVSDHQNLAAGDINGVSLGEGAGWG